MTLNRKIIASLTILIVSLNVKAAKLVFTSEKTPTYNKIDEKFIKYVKYKNQAVEYSDGIGITDGTLDFENLEIYAGLECCFTIYFIFINVLARAFKRMPFINIILSR